MSGKFSEPPAFLRPATLLHFSRGRKPFGFRRAKPIKLLSAPIRHWHWESGFSASRPVARRPQINYERLPGTSHELHSAVAVARDGKILFETVAIARMTMRPLGDAEIEAYLNEAGDAVTTSVGAYQLEGLGIHLFERIEGDHFTILGLPLLPLLAFLRGEELLAL